MMPKALSVGQLLPKSSLLTLDKINWGESGWVLEAHGPDRAPCPACLKVSHSRHSRYWRTLKDLPSHGRASGTRGSRSFRLDSEPGVPVPKDFFQFVIQDLG